MESVSELFVNSSTSEHPENDTLTCVAESIREPVVLPYSETFIATVTALWAIFWICLFPSGTILNTIVIVLFAKYRKKLKIHSFAIALQIVVVDLVLSLTVPVVALISMFSMRWVLGEYMCVIVGMIVSTSSNVRTVLLLALVIDRFLAVYLPFLYPKHVVKSVTALSVISWVVCSIQSIANAAFGCYSFQPEAWVCFVNRSCSSNCSILSSFFTLVVVLPAILIPVLLYIILYIKAKKAMKVLPVVTEGDAASNRHNEWKATITFFFMFVAVCITTIPSLIIFTIANILYGTSDLPPYMYIFTAAGTSVSSLLVITDPIVIMRNRDIREILAKFKTEVVGKLRPNALDGEAFNMQTVSQTFNSTHH